VDAVFGHQIVVSTDNAGKVLVDVGRQPVQPPITVGETLQVTGHVEDNRLEDRSMTRADGRTVVLRGETRGDGQHGEADMIGHDD
jgi:hypothetical protein